MKNIFLSTYRFNHNSISIEGKDYHYLKNVRRVGTGDRINAIIGNVRYCLAVSAVEKGTIKCTIENQREIRNASGISICVYQGLLKVKKMDTVIAKLSEMGVQTFIPLLTERTVPGGNTGNIRMERWLKLAREGSRVSGFESTMKIASPADFHEVAGCLSKNKKTAIILFSTGSHCIHIKSFLESLQIEEDFVFHLFFGPEGGFTDREVAALVQHHGSAVTMGPFVLKSETAALVGTGFIRLYYSGIER